ncbi:TetR family transcriptional regulator [Herbaspirillum camelliae]|uniref:TetR family transcriptional regulator n=1 Tax=Herbaspirillum camelliae TaxID=1892903 RepID=UPI000949CCC7|nr:TetR family transcriptional regulator [Herbaspirillum camelliae]
MARRKKEDALETREKILDAAESCFCMMGVSGTSLQEIATKAGCSRGAISWHFKEPIEILRAVLERGRLPLLDDLAFAATLEHQVLPAFRASLRKSFWLIKNDKHVRAALEILVFRCDFSGGGKEFLEAHRRELMMMRSLFCDVLERASFSKEIKLKCPSSIIASHITSALLGAIKAHFLDLGEVDLETNAVGAIEAILIAEC